MILKLLRHKDTRIFCCHAKSSIHALPDTFSDISGIVDQPDLGSILSDQLSALFTDGIRHDDNGTVTTHCPNQCQTNPLVTAGRLHDDRLLGDLSFSFGRFDHTKGRPRLNRGAHIYCLKLHKNLSILLSCHMMQTNQWSIPHRLKYILINHLFFSFSFHSSYYMPFHLLLQSESTN